MNTTNLNPELVDALVRATSGQQTQLDSALITLEGLFVCIPGLSLPAVWLSEDFEGYLVLAWSKKEYYFDIEILKDGLLNWYFHDRTKDTSYGSDDSISILPWTAVALLGNTDSK